MDKFIRISAWMNILGAVLLVFSWISLGVLNYASIVNGQFGEIFIGSPNIAALILLFASMLLLSAGLFGLFIFMNDFRIYAITGFFCFFVGLIWFTSIQYFETFILPYLASHDPNSFDIIMKGKDILSFTGFVGSAVPWTAGIILFGIALLKCKTFSSTVSIVWIIGGALQLFGALPIRTIGLLLTSFSIVYFGLKMRKQA